MEHNPWQHKIGINFRTVQGEDKNPVHVECLSANENISIHFANGSY